MGKTRERLILLVLLQSLVYSFGDVIAKFIYAGHNLSLILSLRYLAAAAVLFLIAGKKNIPQLRSVSPKIWLPPGIFMGLFALSANLAVKYTAATNVAFLRSLTTLLTPLLALLFFRKKYKLWHVPLQLFVIVGLYLLCAKGGLSTFGLGEVVALLSAAMNACSLIFSERATREMNVFLLAATQTSCSFVLSFLWFLTSGGQWEPLSGSVWLGILYLGLIVTGFGSILQDIVLRGLPSRSVSMLQCTYPVMTAVLSFLLLRELLRPAGIVGAAIIILCVFLENYFKD